MRNPKVTSNARQRVRKRGKETIVKPESWDWLDAIARPLDDDFVKAALDRPQTFERPDIHLGRKNR